MILFLNQVHHRDPKNMLRHQTRRILQEGWVYLLLRMLKSRQQKLIIRFRLFNLVKLMKNQFKAVVILNQMLQVKFNHNKRRNLQKKQLLTNRIYKTKVMNLERIKKKDLLIFHSQKKIAKKYNLKLKKI